MSFSKNPYGKNTKIYNLYEKIKTIRSKEHLLLNNSGLYSSNKILHLYQCIIETHDCSILNEYIDEYLKLYPEIINRRTVRNMTPLMTAAVNTVSASSDKTVEILLNHGANVNLQDERGCSALMIAATNCQKTTVELLLKNNSKLNMKDENGNTALFYAIINSVGDQNFETVKTLLDHGSDVNVTDNEGFTPLMIIDHNRNYFRIMKLILDYGHNVNLQDNKGNTAFMHAFCSTGLNKNIVELFMEYNADINLKNKYGENVITNAFKMVKVRYGRSLLDIILPDRRSFIKNVNANKVKILKNLSKFWRFGSFDFKIIGIGINSFMKMIIFF